MSSAAIQFRGDFRLSGTDRGHALRTSGSVLCGKTPFQTGSADPFRTGNRNPASGNAAGGKPSFYGSRRIMAEPRQPCIGMHVKRKLAVRLIRLAEQKTLRTERVVENDASSAADNLPRDDFSGGGSQKKSNTPPSPRKIPSRHFSGTRPCFTRDARFPYAEALAIRSPAPFFTFFSM